MAPFTFPKVSLDPSKIKDRWGLGAFGLVVWLVIAYVVLTKPVFSLPISLTVLILTFSLLVLMLMVSFTRHEGTARIPSPNILPGRNPQTKQQEITPEDIAFLGQLYEVARNPGVKRMLERRRKR